MKDNVIITTHNSEFNCQKIGVENEGRYWEVNFKQQNGVRGKLKLPDNWAITRVVQYLETIDTAV